MKHKKIFLLALFLALVTGGIFAVLKFRGQEQEIRKGAADQPHLYFKQPENTSQDKLIVDVYVDTAGQETNGVDALIDYDPQVLEFQQAKESNLFPSFNSRVQDGRLYIYNVAESPLTTKSGEFKIAQIEFKIKKEQKTSLSFVCNLAQLTGNSSAIWQGRDATNIIDCSQLKDFTYTPPVGPTGELSPTVTGKPNV